MQHVIDWGVIITVIGKEKIPLLQITLGRIILLIYERLHSVCFVRQSGKYWYQRYLCQDAGGILI